MHRRPVTLLASLAMCLTACHGPRAEVSVTALPTFEAGVQFFPSPRSFDAPGTVFRVTPDGVRRDVADLSSMLHVASTDETIPRTVTRGNTQLALALGWFGNQRVAAQLSRGDSAMVSIVGAHREAAFEADLKRLVDSARVLVDWAAPGKVYVITETIAADSIHIFVSRNVRQAIGDSGLAGSHSPGAFSASWAPGASSEIVAGFRPARRVMYKADLLIKRTGSFETDSLGSVLRLKVTDVLIWRERPR